MGKKKHNKKLDYEAKIVGLVSGVAMIGLALAMFPILLIAVPFIVLGYIEQQKEY